MYRLYFKPNACSLATQVVLNELQQEVEIIDKDQAADFTTLNPVATVPVLLDGDKVLTEGAAVMLYLLDKHPNTLLPGGKANAGANKATDEKANEEADNEANRQARAQGIQNLMFANATMHPAYGRLFFIHQNISDPDAQKQAFTAAAQNVSSLWEVVENRLGDELYLGGEQVSVADILLAVYSRWGAFFPFEIKLGSRVQAMLERVINMPSFSLALQREAEQAKEAA